jgi:hypothetical protein
VLAQRLTGKKWSTVDSDLGLNMLWRVDDTGRYTLDWEIPLDAATGRYRFVITATRYRLTSATFKVTRFSLLRISPVPAAPGRVAVSLSYPRADPISDLTTRPANASGGLVTFKVNGRRITARSKNGTRFSVPAPAGASVTIASGGARDRWGNANSGSVTLR